MNDAPAFLPGLELSRLLYEEAVAPLLADSFPDLRYDAARLGAGSEVQGFDTARSADHDWGPRLLLLLEPSAVVEYGDAITDLLARRLPKHVRGWPTGFTRPGSDGGSAVMRYTDGPVNHHVEVTDLNSWLVERLGTDGAVDGPVTTVDWLSMPQQRLAEVTAGAVFHDGLHRLGKVRSRLRWYPDAVWRYLLACQWMKLSQEEPFVGRAFEVGDDLGSAVVAARQVREAMRLALLQARCYAPYSKWLGSAFARDVPASAALAASLRAAIAATTHIDRERHLCDAYEDLARRHNGLGLTARLEPTRRGFHSRPFQVLGAERFAEALRHGIDDPRLRAAPLTGGVDQWGDSTDFVDQARAVRSAVTELLGGHPPPDATTGGRVGG